MAVVEGAAGALEDEEDEALGVGAIEIDVLGLTAGDKDGDEEIEEEEEGDKEDEALGVVAIEIEIDVLGVTAGTGAGAVEMDRVGVEATGEDGAPLTEGADVTDILGVAPSNATFLTTPPSDVEK